jgi:hypothetical protein
VAATFSQSQGGHAVSAIPHYVSLDFAYATQSVLYVMCAIMGFAGLVAFLALKRGLQEALPERTAGARTE